MAWNIGGGGGQRAFWHYTITEDLKAYDWQGNLVESANAFHTLVNNTVARLPTANARTGIIYIRNGAYSQAADITIGKRTYLLGETCEGVQVTASANMTNAMINVDATNVAWTDWRISNLTLLLNGKTGDGIKTDHGDEDSLYCREYLDNLRIYNVEDTYSCLNLTDLRHWYMGNLRLRMNGEGCFGIKMRVSSATKRGEGLADYILIGGFGVNNHGIDIDGKTGGTYRSAGNISRWNNIHCGGVKNSYGAGSVGLYINDDEDMEFHIHCEGQEHNVHLEGTNSSGYYTENLTFIHPTLINSGTDANQACFYLNDKVWNVNVYGGVLEHATTGNAWVESMSGAGGLWYKPVVFHDVKMMATGGLAPSWSGGNGLVQMYNCNSPDAANIACLERETSAVGAYAAPADPAWRGRLCTQRNTPCSATLLWCYDDADGWHYEVMT